MCPDKQLLSVYYDGEIPSPWKEKMASHLAVCDSCRAAVDAYGALSKTLHDDVPIAASPRRWEPEAARPLGTRRLALRTRRLALPLPFAAAAAVALVVLGAALLLAAGFRHPVDTRTVAEGIALEAQIMPEISTMGDALRFIESDELFAESQSSYVIMRMPENKTFYNFSNPQIRNAANTPSSWSIEGK
jgi:hypothetical protein